jgi:hypothetical protein
MRAKHAGLVVVGAVALILAACGQNSAEQTSQPEVTPPEPAAPTAEQAATDAAAAAATPVDPDAAATPAEPQPYDPATNPNQPPPSKSDEIFY